ncbi:MAG TPA: hypothetical protein VJ946_00510, partial [Bacteroidales bacterium]|nr:hypothetical protein [Bacteroidales bacterium]
AQGGAEFMDRGIPLWFLPALFCVIMIDFLVARLKNPFRLILVATLPFAGFYAYRWLGYHLPWSLDVAMVVYLYYYLGKELRKRNFLELIETKELIFVAIPFLIHLGISQFVPTPTFYYGEYGILPLTYLTGALGFIWLFSLMKLIPSWAPVVWIGQNTLPILTFHLLAMTIIKAIALFVFDMEITFNILTSLGLALLQILLLVPFIILMNRHLPLLVGKWAPKKDSTRDPDKT